MVEQVGCLTLCDLETIGVMCLSLTSFVCEEVDLVSLPAAWEIHAEARVVTDIVRLGGNEHELVTCKDLRYASHCGHHRHGDLEGTRILAHAVTDAGSVVVAREDEHLRKVVIYEIVREDVIYLAHAGSPSAIVLIEGITKSIVKREVHDGRKMRVKAVLVGVAALPVCELRNGRGPALSHYVEVRILVHDCLAPL